MVVEEATGVQPSSSKDGSTGDGWAEDWANELEKDFLQNEQKDRVAKDKPWRLSYTKTMESKPVMKETGSLSKVEQKQLRHGWLNKFAVVIQAMDDGEWDLVKRYVAKFLGIIYISFFLFHMDHNKFLFRYFKDSKSKVFTMFQNNVLDYSFIRHVLSFRFRGAKDMAETIKLHKGCKYSNRGVDKARNYLALGPQW